MGGCSSITPGFASSWVMARTSCSSSIQSDSGTTLDHRARIIATLRERGGELLNEEAVWTTKQGQLVHVLISYVQVAYRGGHVSFLGGKRVLWVYDITALRQREAQIAEQERQFREILEYCPAALNVVDEDGRLLFHNARLRELFGYDADELVLFDTRRFWHDLDQRSRIIESLRARRATPERGGGLEDEARPAGAHPPVLCPGRLSRRSRQLRRRQARAVGLRRHRAEDGRGSPPAERAAPRRGDREHLGGLRVLRRRGPAGAVQFL